MLLSHRSTDQPGDERSRPTLSATPWLLLLALLLIQAQPANAVWPFDRWFSDTPLDQRAAEILSSAIATRTVNPPGNEAALAEQLSLLLDHQGLEHRVLETPTAVGSPARAAVWGRLRGKGERPAILLLSHLDTVPAIDTDWSVDPFEGKIEGGFVWGRGALDAKGVAVTHLLTLLELARKGPALERDLIFLATPDEETGGLEGAGWLVKNHPELLEGVGYLLTEGGGIQARPPRDDDAPAIWGVTLTEKAPCWLELRARGRAGHSSSPSPDAAVPRLIAALDRIRRLEAPVRIIPEVKEMFSQLAPLANEWDRAAFRDLEASLESDPAFRRRFLDNPGQNALVRNTVSITVLEGAAKTNVAPAMARAQLDVRLLPGESCEQFAGAIGELIDEPSIEIETILSFPAAASPSNTPLYRAIQRVAQRQPDPAIVVPRLIGGFTDAHWFRKLGIVAYGFVPRTLGREEARRVHGIDERVAISTLVEGVGLTLQILRELDAVESQ